MLVQSECDMENPEQFAAWAFAAGVPDPRGERYAYQPLIPGKCHAVFSRLLWDLGFRHHAELQTKWVGERSGPMRNFEAWGSTDVKPEDIMGDVAAMAAEQFPEVAAKIAAIEPGKQQEAVEAQAKELLSALDRLREANELLKAQSQNADAAIAAVAEDAGEADGGAT